MRNDVTLADLWAAADPLVLYLTGALIVVMGLLVWAVIRLGEMREALRVSDAENVRLLENETRAVEAVVLMEARLEESRDALEDLHGCIGVSLERLADLVNTPRMPRAAQAWDRLREQATEVLPRVDADATQVLPKHREGTP